MQLVVLGSGTTIPHGDRGCAAHAVLADDGSILLLDAGPGSTRRYPLVGLDPRRIVGVVNTHHHADHCAEIPILLFLRNVLDPPIETPFSLVGPVGHRAFVSGVVASFAPGLSDLHDTFRIDELRDGDERSIGPFRVRVREIAHIPGSLAVRVDCDGRSMTFSGDSGPCDALTELCRDVDVALLECSYPASRESASHLNTSTVARTAVSAGVSRLVLTHFYPDCLEVDIAREVRAAGYANELVLATDGLRIDLGGAP